MKTAMIVAILVVFLLAAAMVGGWLYLSLPFKNTRRVAVYDHLIAEFATDRVISISVGKTIGNQGGPAQLYTRIGSRIVRVMELTHEDADQLPLEHCVSRMPDGSVLDDYSCGFTIISFDGKAVDLATFEEYMPIDLAPTPRGPWFQLPVSPKRLQELFGKPVRWTRVPTLQL